MIIKATEHIMMTETQLKASVAVGEDSTRQFKRRFERAESIAAELVAMANSGGGDIFVGVEDDGTLAGLSPEEVRELNQQLSNAASQTVRPPIHPLTENVMAATGVVVIIHVENGINKPYVDRQGRVWIRSGADKRHVTSREELQRMFQRSALIEADVLPLPGTSSDDIDRTAFVDYVGRFFSFLRQDGLSDEHLLKNMGFIRKDCLTIAGALFFSQHAVIDLPSLSVRALVLPGTELSDTRYLDTETIEGTLQQQYRGCMSFFKRNLVKRQTAASFNSPGTLEVSETVLEELLVNALVHRDLLIRAPIRVFIFSDRIEIISPGSLPENQTVETLKLGSTLRRNPVLAQHAERLLPFRGVGSGILRVLQEEPRVQFVNNIVADEFKVIIPRRLRLGAAATQKAAPKRTPSGGRVERLLSVMTGEMSRNELQDALVMKSRSTFAQTFLKPAITEGYIEMTDPSAPQSKSQKYRLTEKGERYLEARAEEVQNG